MPIAPPPIKDGNFPYSWQEWFRQLRDLIQTSSGAIPWASVSKTGSNLTEIVTRNHDQLQNISGGGTSHLSSGQYTTLSGWVASGIPHSSLTSVLGSGSYHLSSTEQAALTNSATGTWTPTFTNLTVVGSITAAGRYTRVGRMVFWQVTLTSSGGGTSAATVASTYHDLPFLASQHDTSTAVNFTTLTSIGNGVLDSTNDRNYVPSWTATTNTIVLSGRYEV